ncbi:hypothetical protein Barb6_02651 [Bacteroidales bacterium Barb6]|nr:hypothetical protein Barb6_02651 [Bacteroidales bacterium Barb6]
MRTISSVLRLFSQTNNLLKTYENPKTHTITRTYKDGLKIKKFKNGLHLEERANGDIFKKYPNGNTEFHSAADKSVFTAYADGETMLMNKNGTYLREFPDGTRIRKLPTLKGQTRASIIMDINNGHSVKWTPDGKVWERKLYANGKKSLQWTEIETTVGSPKLRKSARLSYGTRPSPIPSRNLRLPPLEGGGKFVNPSIAKGVVKAAQFEKTAAFFAAGIRSFSSFLAEQVFFTLLTEYLLILYDMINPDEGAVIDDARPLMVNTRVKGYDGVHGRGAPIDGTETAVQRTEASYSGLSMFTSSKDSYYELNPKYNVNSSVWDKSYIGPDDFVQAVRGYTGDDWEHANLGVTHPAIKTPFATEEYKALRARDQFVIGLNDYSMANSSMDQLWMPKEITRIGAYTFARAKINLLSFEEDSRLAKIDRYAFSHSTFEELDFMCNYHLVRIEEGAFSNMPDLDMLLLPESVVYLGQGLVRNTPKLDTIYVSWTEPYQLQLLKDNLQNYTIDAVSAPSHTTAYNDAKDAYDAAVKNLEAAEAALAEAKVSNTTTNEGYSRCYKKAADARVALDAAASALDAAIPRNNDIFMGKKICIPAGSYSVYKTMFPGTNGMFGGDFDLGMNMPFTIVAADRETLQIKEMLDDEDYSPRLKELVDEIHKLKIEIVRNNRKYRDEKHALICNNDKLDYYKSNIEYLQSEISNLDREATFYEEYSGLKRPEEEPFGIGSLGPHSSDLPYIDKNYGHKNVFFPGKREVADYNPNSLYLSLDEENRMATILPDSTYDNLEKLVIPYSVTFRGREYPVIPLTIEYISGLDEDGDGEDDAALTLALDYHEAVDVDIDNEFIIDGHFASLPYLNSVTFGSHTKFIGSELGFQVREFDITSLGICENVYIADSAFSEGSKVFVDADFLIHASNDVYYSLVHRTGRDENGKETYWTKSGAQVIFTFMDHNPYALKSADGSRTDESRTDEFIVTPNHTIDIRNGVIYNKEEYLTTVFDMAGRMRISSRAREINLAVLPEGNYLVVSNKRRIKIHL